MRIPWFTMLDGYRPTMRTSQPRHVVRWYIMAAGAETAEAELRTLGVSYMRHSGTLTWTDGDAEVFTYEFHYGRQIAPVFEAVDRITGAGHWFDGWYMTASGFPQ